jgi:hypothetical protein
VVGTRRRSSVSLVLLPLLLAVQRRCR